MLSEFEEQKSVVTWLRAQNLFFFAPTNENNTYNQNKKFAMIAEQKAKAAGKLKGVSDLVVFTGRYILFIEMKRAPKKLKSGKLSYTNSKVSDAQKNFLETVQRYPYARARVCYGAKEAIDYITKYI
jgi:hypothetical protein